MFDQGHVCVPQTNAGTCVTKVGVHAFQLELMSHIQQVAVFG